MQSFHSSGVTAQKFRRKSDSVLRWLRSCAACGSVLPPIDLLCGNCWLKLKPLLQSGTALDRRDYPFPVYSLCAWTPDNDYIIGACVKAMKGGWNYRATHAIATQFLFERGLIGGNVRGSIFIPAPSRTGKVDHAGLFAAKFAALCKGAYSPVFLPYRGSQASQKAKNIESRADLRFELSSICDTSCLRGDGRKIIFVDDVITSGATAMAAYMALDDPTHFEVWTFANRPKLAGNSVV